MGVLTRWLPLVASCLLATGCSMASLGYEFFPTWAHWQIDSYLSLEAEQKAIVQRRLSELHGWHRQSQLPGYVEFLRTTRERAMTASAPQQADTVRKTLQTAWNPIAEQIAPGMAELLLTLKPQQIERMAAQFAKENRKTRDEYLPGGRPDARQDARVERIRKRFEYFLGDLTVEQEKLLRQHARDAPPNEEHYLAEREARQQRFLTLVRRVQTEAPALAEVERLCREYLSGLWVSADPVRRQRMEQASQRSDQMAVSLLGTTTTGQAAHFSERLRKWERDLSRMAGID